MLLTRLQLRNFGPFLGFHRLEMRPLDPHRPIVIIGGNNGTGKTTILEALRLCLYGRRALGTRLSEQEYQDYLSAKVSRTPRESPGKASVGIEFEHSQAGTRSVYYVERSWERRQQRVIEDLLVMRDGHPLRTLQATHWQNFINDLISPALSQFFFFDGERIQSLAEDHHDLEFAESVRTLLGLDLVDQLRTDLVGYLARITKASHSEPEQRLRSLISEREQLLRSRETTLQKAAGFRARIDKQKSLLRRQEDLLAKEGALFAEQRVAHEARRQHLSASLEVIEEQVRALSGGLLPFALAPDLSAQVVETLNREQEESGQMALLRAGALILEEMEALLNDPGFWNIGERTVQEIDPEAREVLRTRLLERFARYTSDSEAPNPRQRIHGLSAGDSARVAMQLQHAISEIGPAMHRHAATHAEMEDELRTVTEDLLRAPTDESLRPLFDHLARLHQEFAELQQGLDSTESELKEFALRIHTLEREIDQVSNLLEEGRTSARRLQLTTRIQRLLPEFQSALTAARVAELERTVEYCFKRLARKEDLVDRISIDPDVMKTTLFNGAGQAISKSALSAGEKQIYAIALLWGLAQVSGRKLPMIIDTPLGRLDTEHRRNLAVAYFPFAAEQVVLLSTDTEVSESYLRSLAPAISRAYTLTFDTETSTSRINDGYFWPLPQFSVEPPNGQIADDDESTFESYRRDDGSETALDPVAAQG